MSVVARYLSLIRFEHTLFALPFALMSLLIAADGRPAWPTLAWVLVAMVGARSAAMAFNRLVDAPIDAANPRTSDRHLPSGAVSRAGVVVFTALSAALLVLAAWRLNPLCFRLSPVALAVILGYSLTKRFTALAHLVLGLGLGIAPIGAWLAVQGSFAAFPLWMAAGVMFWVAGFDTIYACQDAEFDRDAGLHSLASRLGVGRALWLSRIFHVVSVALLAIAFSRVSALGAVSLAGVAVMAGLLMGEQVLVRGGDLRRIDRAFFEINSWIGIILLVFVAVDLYLL